VSLHCHRLANNTDHDAAFSAPAASTQNLNANAANTSALGSQAQIDITHLRSTTKFDQLTPDLQKEIEAVDTLVLNQINLASEVANLIPTVIAAGETLPNDTDFVSQKIDEVEAGLGNDAEAIVASRDGGVKKNENEAKCVFRAVDRLKMPRQYQQVSHGQNESFSGGVYGGAGLSGWWNNPQTLRGSIRSGHTQGDRVQLPAEDGEEDQGPKSLVELFNNRATNMQAMIKGNKQLLGQIEDFVQGLEGKIGNKEQDLNDRLNYGQQNGNGVSERDQQIQELKMVFGEVHRSLYVVADMVGAARDDVAQLTIGR
jgi:nucleoporin p58/p45